MRPKAKRIRSKYARQAKKKCSSCREFGHCKNSCPNQAVKHGRARRADDNDSKDDLNKLNVIEIQSDIDIKETQTRNDANNTPSELTALETVDDENEDLDTPALCMSFRCL